MMPAQWVLPWSLPVPTGFAASSKNLLTSMIISSLFFLKKIISHVLGFGSLQGDSVCSLKTCKGNTRLITWVEERDDHRAFGEEKAPELFG